MPADAVKALADLNALRNYPVHADSRARNRLQSRFVGVASFTDLLQVEVVIELMRSLDRACRYAEQVGSRRSCSPLGRSLARLASMR